MLHEFDVLLEALDTAILTVLAVLTVWALFALVPEEDVALKELTLVSAFILLLMFVELYERFFCMNICGDVVERKSTPVLLTNDDEKKRIIPPLRNKAAKVTINHNIIIIK